jgi:hypothetical protein
MKIAAKPAVTSSAGHQADQLSIARAEHPAERSLRSRLSARLQRVAGAVERRVDERVGARVLLTRTERIDQLLEPGERCSRLRCSGRIDGCLTL